MPQNSWSHIAIDLITNLPTPIKSEGYTTVLTVADRFSHGIKLVLVPTLPSYLEVEEILFNQVFRYYGIPEDIVNDRGPQLM